MLLLLTVILLSPVVGMKSENKITYKDTCHTLNIISHNMHIHVCPLCWSASFCGTSELLRVKFNLS